MNYFKKIWRGINLWLQGYVSLTDVVNLIVNQIIFKCTAWMYELKSWLAGDRKCIFAYNKYLRIGHSKKPKRALLSFVRAPIYKQYFRGRIKYFFSTNGLVLGWVKVLNKLGFVCDIIDLTDQTFIPRHNYDVAIFHGGQNVRAIMPKLGPKTIKLSFETGVHYATHNLKERERFEFLKLRRGFDLPFDRKVNNEESAEYVFRNTQAIIVLGGNFTKQSFSQYAKVYNLPNGFYYDEYFFKKNFYTAKDVSAAKKNFLFFSGGGNVHKGLDLILEAFSQTPDLDLYICTAVQSEFAQAYKKELALPNIHVVGYLPQRSKGFYKLIQTCAFNIHPSCSEGSPGSIVELLQYGIIPIVSKESSIDAENLEFVLPVNTVAAIVDAIRQVSGQSDEWLLQQSNLAREMAFANYTQENFENRLESILKLVLSENI